MPAGLIPLFPLEAVVFPRTRLPLHIFEERYKQMVGNAIRDGSEFGIILAREDGIAKAGCTVAVEKVLEIYPDGRMDIITRGRRRFEVLGLNEEKEYLQGEVSFFDDEDFAPVPAELRTQALARFHELETLDSSEESELDLEDPQLSFQLAQSLPDLEFLAGLLEARSEAGRLENFSRYVADYLPKKRAIERVRTVAPTNGFGGKLAGT